MLPRVQEAEAMIRRAAVSFVIALVMCSGVQAQAQAPAPSQAPAKAPDSAERRVVAMLGLADHYDTLFTSAGMITVAFSGSAGNPATITRFFDAKSDTVLGYFWEPQVAEVRQLTRQAFVDGCGNPDAAKDDTATWGNVTLTFGTKSQVSKILIRLR
jgi:hypothetical protein